MKLHFIKGTSLAHFTGATEFLFLCCSFYMLLKLHNNLFFKCFAAVVASIKVPGVDSATEPSFKLN